MGITTRYQGTSVFDKLQVHKGKFYLEGYAMPLQWTVTQVHDMGVDTAVNTAVHTAVVNCKLVKAEFVVTELAAGAAATQEFTVSSALAGATKLVTNDGLITVAETVAQNRFNAVQILPHNLTQVNAGEIVYIYTAAGAGGDRTAGKVLAFLTFEAV